MILYKNINILIYDFNCVKNCGSNASNLANPLKGFLMQAHQLHLYLFLNILYCIYCELNENPMIYAHFQSTTPMTMTKCVTQRNR